MPASVIPIEFVTAALRVDSSVETAMRGEGVIFPPLSLFQQTGDTANDRELLAESTDCIDASLDNANREAAIQKSRQWHVHIIRWWQRASAGARRSVQLPARSESVRSTTELTSPRRTTDRFWVSQRAVRRLLSDV